MRNILAALAQAGLLLGGFLLTAASLYAGSGTSPTGISTTLQIAEVAPETAGF